MLKTIGTNVAVVDDPCFPVKFILVSKSVIIVTLTDDRVFVYPLSDEV